MTSLHLTKNIMPRFLFNRSESGSRARNWGQTELKNKHLMRHPNQIMVVDGDAIVARHDRLSNQCKTAPEWHHDIELIQRKP